MVLFYIILLSEGIIKVISEGCEPKLGKLYA